jgi:hypothetical protein
MTPADAAAAAGLRKPETSHTQGKAMLMTDAGPPGKEIINSPSNAL